MLVLCPLVSAEKNEKNSRVLEKVSNFYRTSLQKYYLEKSFFLNNQHRSYCILFPKTIKRIKCIKTVFMKLKKNENSRGLETFSSYLPCRCVGTNITYETPMVTFSF